jgi:hypothetical protein
MEMIRGSAGASVIQNTATLAAKALAKTRNPTTAIVQLLHSR